MLTRAVASGTGSCAHEEHPRMPELPYAVAILLVTFTTVFVIAFALVPACAEPRRRRTSRQERLLLPSSNFASWRPPQLRAPTFWSRRTETRTTVIVCHGFLRSFFRSAGYRRIWTHGAGQRATNTLSWVGGGTGESTCVDGQASARRRSSR